MFKYEVYILMTKLIILLNMCLPQITIQCFIHSEIYFFINSHFVNNDFFSIVIIIPSLLIKEFLIFLVTFNHYFFELLMNTY